MQAQTSSKRTRSCAIGLVTLILLASASWGAGIYPVLANEAGPARDADLISSASDVRTLILFDRHKMQSLYGAPAAADLLIHLDALALDTRVDGRVIMVESHPAVAAALAAWEAQPANNQLANAVSDAIREVVMDWQRVNPQIEYLILVGDDRAIPFRRVNDRTLYPESHYPLAAEITTTVGAALAADMFFTDDFYADREFMSWEGQDVYLPDLAVGRLVETPTEINGQIAYFLDHPGPRVIERRLVAGFDFIQDAAARICELLDNDIGDTNLDCTLIGDSWSIDQLRERLLQRANDLISLNTYASHTAFRSPLGSWMTTAEVMSSAVEMAGDLVYHIADHAGLNVPPESAQPLDWPQVFAGKRAVYIASTGYAWGTREGIIFAEAMMVQLTQELVSGQRQQVGKALVRAKQAYYQGVDVFDHFHEKTLMEFILFGLPMYEIETGISADRRAYLPIAWKGY